VSIETNINGILGAYERLGKIVGTTSLIVGPTVAGVVVLRHFFADHDVGV
jgi:hypothetical protein